MLPKKMREGERAMMDKILRVRGHMTETSLLYLLTLIQFYVEGVILLR